MSSVLHSTVPLRPDMTSDRGLGAGAAWLVLVTALTRWPAWHNRFGESDTARYAVGILQWLRHPRHAAAPEIYGRVFSPAYDWGAVTLLRHVPRAAPDLLIVLNGASFVAALLSAPVALAVARRFVAQIPAFWATLLFIMTPAFWWLGIEPHPQGWSSLGYLLAIWLTLRAREAPARAWTWRAASAMALACGLAFKSDLVLGMAVFPVLELYPAGMGGDYRAVAPRHPQPAVHGGAGRRAQSERKVARGAGPSWTRCNWLWRCAIGTLVPAAASFLFLAMRALILGEGWKTSQSAAGHAVKRFVAWPQGPDLVKQVLPMWLGAGVLTPLFLVGAVYAWRRWGTSQRRFWILLLTSWSVPGALFWFLIRGNNARHTVLLILPWLWLAAAGWYAQGRERATVFTLAVLAANFLIVPPNSNIALYPSGNVPVSAARLADRQGEMRRVAQRLCHPPPPSCYFGWYTSPYVEYDLMQHCGRYGVLQSWGGATRFEVRVGSQGLVAPRTVDLREVHDELEFQAAVRACPGAASLEYSPAGKTWYFGREVRDRLR